MMDNNDSPVPLSNKKTISEEQDRLDAEMVEDNDAAEYEEKHAGIKISYSLKKEEINACIKHNNEYRKKKNKATSLAFVFIAISFVFALMYTFHSNITMVLFSLMMVFFGLVAFLIPDIDKRYREDKVLTKNPMNVEIYPDAIEVEERERAFSIPLNGTCFFEEFQGLMVITMPDEKFFVIPERSIDRDFFADVQAIIIAGTEPVTDK